MIHGADRAKCERWQCQLVIACLLGVMQAANANAQSTASDSGRWEAQLGVVMPLMTTVSTVEVKARLLPTVGVAIATRVGGIRSPWMVRGQFALLTGYAVTPGASCGSQCIKASGRQGTIATALVERGLTRSARERPELRAGLGVRTLFFPGLGSNCSPGDRPCVVIIELSTPSVRPAATLAAYLPIGSAFSVSASSVISQLHGRGQVDLFVSAGRRFGQ